MEKVTNIFSIGQVMLSPFTYCYWFLSEFNDFQCRMYQVFCSIDDRLKNLFYYVGIGSEMPLQQGIPRASTGMCTLEEPQLCPAKWYFSKEEIEDHSPSRKEGIDLKYETHLRKLYCSFLQDLGMKLKV